jgi:hypothetical protein
MVLAASVEQVAEACSYGGDQQVVDCAAVVVRGRSKVLQVIPEDNQSPLFSDGTGE